MLSLFWIPGFSFRDFHVLVPILLSILPCLFCNSQQNYHAPSICLFSCSVTSIICLKSWINRHCLTNLSRQMLLYSVSWRQTSLLSLIYCQTGGVGGGRSSIQKAMIYTILNNTFLFMKPLQFAMSMHPKNHIDKYQDFPLRMKSITFTWFLFSSGGDTNNVMTWFVI